MLNVSFFSWRSFKCCCKHVGVPSQWWIGWKWQWCWWSTLLLHWNASCFYFNQACSGPATASQLTHGLMDTFTFSSELNLHFDVSIPTQICANANKLCCLSPKMILEQCMFTFLLMTTLHKLANRLKVFKWSPLTPQKDADLIKPPIQHQCLL